MPHLSLLQMVTKACKRLSLSRPTSVMASTDPNIMLLSECASEEGLSLAGRHNWQAILFERTFITIAEPNQAVSVFPGVSAVAPDLDRFIPETMFNRTTNRRLDGPIDSAMWQSIQSSLVTFVNPAFRFRDNKIYITPTPVAGHTVAYEYISTYWCQSSIATSQVDWLADTDTYRLNDESMVQGIVWRFKKAKGLAWQDDYLVYERYVGDLIVRDGSRPRIFTDQKNWDRRPVPPYIPETLEVF